MAATKTRNTIQTMDWGSMKNEWMAKNMTPHGPPYTLKDLANQYGAAYGTVKNRAAREGWRSDLTEALGERDELASKEVLSRAVWDVAEVRWRQARIARVAMQKAMEVLKDVTPENTTKSEAIRLLELGMEQERRALGIPTVTKIQHEHPTDDTYESVEDRMERVRRFRDLATRFEQFVEGRDRRENVRIAAR